MITMKEQKLGGGFRPAMAVAGNLPLPTASIPASDRIPGADSSVEIEGQPSNFSGGK
jgi:hypothetical protein